MPITAVFEQNMKYKNYKLRSKNRVILLLFILITVAGIAFVLSNFSILIIYQQITYLIIAASVWIVTLMVINWINRTYFEKPIERLTEVSRAASLGDLSKRTGYNNTDEIGQIAVAIDNIIENQLKLAEFAEKIGDGNFDVEYKILSAQDKLGSSITGMRDKLQKIAYEDISRNWASQGLTKFGEITREDADNLTVLCDKFLSSLAKYINANQGMIFLLNTEDSTIPNLKLESAYAWDKKKYIKRIIEIGEGLIGQAAIEKDIIYMTDVPKEFITITSGLGDATPTCVIIVPMMFNNELFGILELASFRELKNFEIEFVQKLAEILASTISRVRTNEQTQKLLKDSQKLTEEMRAQEEEMRQNIEEMNATQEEMEQREVERIGIFTAINNTLATVEFNMEGKIINANEKFLQLMNYNIDEIENKTDRMFADLSNEPIEYYNEFWKELRLGKPQKGDFKRITKEGREIWINASYTPALDKDQKPYKVIELAQDITEKKKVELETQRQGEELRIQGEKLKSYTTELEDIKQNLSEKLNEASNGLLRKIKDIESERAKNVAVLEGCVDGVICFNQEGIIEYFNNAAEDIWGLEREKIIGKPISNAIPISIQQKDNMLTAYYLNNGSTKEIGVRTEVSWQDENSKEYDLLMTLTRAKVDDSISFTIFAQQISIDLF
jgi:PAS domain S-box-containing protein